MRAETLERSAVQGLTVIRMRNGNEETGALLKGFSVKIHGAVFGNDPLDIGARGNDAGAGFEGGYDLGGKFRGT